MKKVFIILIGVLFTGIGIFIFVRENELTRKCTKETVAKVIDVVEEIDTDSDGFNSYTYFPVIEYYVNGNKITNRSASGSNPPKYDVNDTVIILYNPDNIKEYIIKGDKSSNLLSIIFVVCGLGLIIYGAITKDEID